MDGIGKCCSIGIARSIGCAVSQKVMKTMKCLLMFERWEIAAVAFQGDLDLDIDLDLDLDLEDGEEEEDE